MCTLYSVHNKYVGKTYLITAGILKGILIGVYIIIENIASFSYKKLKRGMGICPWWYKTTVTYVPLKYDQGVILKSMFLPPVEKSSQRRQE